MRQAQYPDSPCPTRATISVWLGISPIHLWGLMSFPLVHDQPCALAHFNEGSFAFRHSALAVGSIERNREALSCGSGKIRAISLQARKNIWFVRRRRVSRSRLGSTSQRQSAEASNRERVNERPVQRTAEPVSRVASAAPLR